MTDPMSGERGTDGEMSPQDLAHLRAALGALGDPRGGAEADDAALLARVLSQAAAPAPAPTVPVPSRAPRRAIRRGVAATIAAVALAATLAFAAQRLFTAEPAEPAPAPPASSAQEAPPHGTSAPAQPAPPAKDEPAKDEPAPSTSTSASAAANEPAPVRSAPPREPGQSADAMLKQAQERMAGGDSAGALAAYRALIARHPGSSEARAALMTLGRTSLRNGNAGEALASFDRYLAGGGGPLAIEAQVGRIAALRALGRTADERAAITTFLARHGDGVHAARLRARLAELQGR